MGSLIRARSVGEASDNLKRTKVWAPQPGPQHALVECPLPEIFFGGARGGGKTDGVLGKWALKERRYGKAFNAIMFRRTTVSSEDAIERSKQIFGPLGGRYNESKLIWRMPNGGKVSFAYLDSVQDAGEYQGRNVTDVWIEEAGQYPDSAPIDRLFGVMRSADGVPVQMILTANPGGAGQQWIRRRYQLVPFPKHPKVLSRTLENGTDHRMAVIPSRITDNKILMKGDPGYVNRLYMVGGKALVKAWLDGDWSAVEGAFFDDWDEKRHVIEPFAIPADWRRFRSGDWGSAKPFSFGWWAIVGDDYPIYQMRDGVMRLVVLPRGALVRYREWYGCQEHKPNTGIKLTAEEVGRGIKERDAGEKFSGSVLDPAAFAQDGGPSIAARIAKKGPKFSRADNKRVGSRGALGGWDMMRARLKGDGDGRPMIYWFSTCTDSIRTIPVLQHDEKRPEDLDTDMEDHAADETRYACMSRQWLPPLPEKPKPEQPPGSVVLTGPPEKRSRSRTRI